MLPVKYESSARKDFFKMPSFFPRSKIHPFREVKKTFSVLSTEE